MIKELAKVANKLDSLGLTKEADLLDSLIRKEATEDLEGKYKLRYLHRLLGKDEFSKLKMEHPEIISFLLNTHMPVAIRELIEDYIVANIDNDLSLEGVIRALDMYSNYNTEGNLRAIEELDFNKSAMHLGEGYLTCDECGTRFSEFKAGSKTSRGHHVCPQCSEDVSPEEVEKRRSGAFESSRSRRSRD